MVNKVSNSDSSDKFYPGSPPSAKPPLDLAVDAVATRILKDVKLDDSVLDGRATSLAGKIDKPQETKVTEAKQAMLDIKASLDKIPVTQISENDLQIIADYILKNRSVVQEKAKSHPNGTIYVRIGLPRAIQFNANGKVYIHFNKGKLGDKILGEGSAKRVRIAMDFDSKTLYAVASSTIKSREQRIISDRENAFLKKMKGRPGIAQIVEEVKVSGKKGLEKTFSIQPIYNKGDLSGSVQTLTDKEKYKVTLDILRALALLQDLSVIHRDIKPENIFLQKTEGQPLEAVIADFGLACMSFEEDQKNNFSGTPAYVDPERMRAAYYEKQSIKSVTSCLGDMWAFGLVLYILEHKHSAFPELPDTEKMIKFIAGLSRGLSSLPSKDAEDPIRGLIDRCLITNPLDRISAKQALAIFGPKLQALI